MSTETIITYGPGGYDPDKPDDNVTDRRTVTIPAEDVNRYALLDKAHDALIDNKTFLDLPDYPANPTAAQRDMAIRALIAQDRALTRQVNAIIRLLTQAFDDVSDT